MNTTVPQTGKEMNDKAQGDTKSALIHRRSKEKQMFWKTLNKKRFGIKKNIPVVYVYVFLCEERGVCVWMYLHVLTNTCWGQKRLVDTL